MTTNLPTWIERLLGIEPARSGEGIVWSLEHGWGWAPGVSLILAMSVVLLVCWNYWHESAQPGRGWRALLAALRLGALAVVGLMLAEFILSLERTGLPHVVFLVDDSLSMGIADRYEETQTNERLGQRTAALELEGATRFNLAKTLLLERNGQHLRRVARDYNVKLFLIGQSVREQRGTLDQWLAEMQSLEPNSDSTQLGAGIRGVLNSMRGTPPSAMVLITDGVNTEGEALAQAAQFARRKGVPVYAVAVGLDQPSKDLHLHDLLVDDVVFVGDTVKFEAKLTASGYLGRDFDVVLRRKDDPSELARSTVHIAEEGRTQVVRLSYRPTEVGQFEYQLEVAAQADETQSQNNAQERLIDVRQEQIRVLLVQAYPNYEFRYLKQMLDRDNTIHLDTVLQEADPEYSAADRTALGVFPVRREQLFEYDVVIFGDANPAFLSTAVLENLSAFVTEKGGGLIVAAGPRYTPWAYFDTPLGELLPVEQGGSSPEPRPSIIEGFQPQPTDLGLASTVMQLGDDPEQTVEIWRNLAPLYWFFESTRLKPGAQALAEHPDRLTAEGEHVPILCLQYTGAGKVLFHATDETWRWRYQVGDVYFARYWVQAIRYLSRAKLLGKDRTAELTVDRRSYRRGDPVRMRVRFTDERAAPSQDDGVTVIVEQGGSRKRNLKLTRNPNYRGIFEGELAQVAEGDYHVWMAEPATKGTAATADFSVVAPPGEMQRTQADRIALREAALATRGKYYDFADAEKLFDELPTGRQVPIEALPPVVLWNRWPLLALFLVLIVSEWMLRKVKGMA
jgi:hypothetical protein